MRILDLFEDVSVQFLMMEKVTSSSELDIQIHLFGGKIIELWSRLWPTEQEIETAFWE